MMIIDSTDSSRPCKEVFDFSDCDNICIMISKLLKLIICDRVSLHQPSEDAIFTAIRNVKPQRFLTNNISVCGYAVIIVNRTPTSKSCFSLQLTMIKVMSQTEIDEIENFKSQFIKINNINMLPTSDICKTLDYDARRVYFKYSVQINYKLTLSNPEKFKSQFKSVINQVSNVDNNFNGSISSKFLLSIVMQKYVLNSKTFTKIHNLSSDVFVNKSAQLITLTSDEFTQFKTAILSISMSYQVAHKHMAIAVRNIGDYKQIILTFVMPQSQNRICNCHESLFTYKFSKQNIYIIMIIRQFLKDIDHIHSKIFNSIINV